MVKESKHRKEGKKKPQWTLKERRAKKLGKKQERAGLHINGDIIE